MTNKTIIIAISATAVAATAFYKLYWDSKLRYAKIVKLKSKVEGSVDKLMTFDKQFLKEWANALQKGEETFLYSGNKLIILSDYGSVKR
jgi:predicted nucleic-acid-binding protein